jgi:hypothetical protein
MYGMQGGEWQGAARRCRPQAESDGAKAKRRRRCRARQTRAMCAGLATLTRRSARRRPNGPHALAAIVLRSPGLWVHAVDAHGFRRRADQQLGELALSGEYAEKSYGLEGF